MLFVVDCADVRGGGIVLVLSFTTVNLPCYIELTAAILFSFISRGNEVGEE